MGDRRAFPNHPIVARRARTSQPSGVLDGVFWINRTGAPWRDLPEAFGNWRSIWRQFRRWCQSGVWDVLLQGLADSGGELDALQMIDRYHDPGTSLRRRRKGGIQFQALGRSRGGFATKVHLRCNAVGLPAGVVLTTGEAHDVTAYDALMEQRDSDPGAMLADKGYDSSAIRHDLHDRGAAPEIPTKSNRKVQQSVSKRLYSLRSRIECFIVFDASPPPTRSGGDLSNLRVIRTSRVVRWVMPALMPSIGTGTKRMHIAGSS